MNFIIEVVVIDRFHCIKPGVLQLACSEHMLNLFRSTITIYSHGAGILWSLKCILGCLFRNLLDWQFHYFTTRGAVDEALASCMIVHFSAHISK